MRITFARGGGFAAPLRPKVSGTINLGDNGSEVSSNSTYHRALAPEEVEQIRAGADPSELTRAERQVAANTSGAGDLDHYVITVTTKDGQTHEISLNMSGAPNEMKNVSPATSKFLTWVRNEVRKIQAHNRAQ